MPSNKDILEAQRFNRRRLVTAFTSGTPGGKELESKSTPRPLIVGASVAAVVLLIAVAIGRFLPTLPSGWENSHLIMTKGEGARYYSIEGTLRPISNVTSAKLLSETGKLVTSSVSTSSLEGIPRGSAIGLADVPDDIPTANQLHSYEWTSCATTSGIKTWVAGNPKGLESASTALVSNEGRLYLVTGGVRYPIDIAHAQAVVNVLDLSGRTITPVTANWLNLFTEGSMLEPLEIPNVGRPVSGMSPRITAAQIGTIIEVDESGAPRRYVITGDGTITPLTDFSYKLYQASWADRGSPQNLMIDLSELASLTVVTQGIVPSDWPTQVGDVLGPDVAPCAQLTISHSRASTVLVSLPTTEITQQKPREVNVRGGSGALVRASSGGSGGPIIFISDLGKAHGLGPNPSDSLAHLGLPETAVSPLPAAWLALVPEGQELTTSAAWETVGAQ
jgi:type VII secretion protein eccB